MLIAHDLLCVQVYRGHRDVVRTIVCIPEKLQLITAGWDHSIRVWALPSLKGREVCLCPPRPGGLEKDSIRTNYLTGARNSSSGSAVICVYM